jgi:hypothetical protein
VLTGHRVGAAALVGLVAVLLWAVPVRAAAGPSRFCAAVQVAAVARPSSTADLVGVLRRLGRAAPAPVGAAVSAVVEAVQLHDAASVLDEAAALPSSVSPLAAAGATIVGAAGQQCRTALDLRRLSPTGISKRRIEPRSWAKVVCTKLSTWGHTLDDLGTKLVTEVNGPTTLSAVRQAVSNFVAAAVLTTEQLVKTLAGAGAATAPRGLEFAVYVHDGLVQAEQSFQAAQSAAQALPGDPRTFQTAGQALVQRLDTTGRQVEALVRDANTRVRSRALSRAFAATPACAGIA